MADTEINVVNRPTVLANAWGAFIQAWPILASISVAVVTFGIWLTHLEGKTDINAMEIGKVNTALGERDARWAADQAAQNARVDRIEESRTVGLQRLATVEEAVKGQNRTLDAISTKLDRLLMGGRLR